MTVFVFVNQQISSSGGWKASVFAFFQPHRHAEAVAPVKFIGMSQGTF
jgi:hypothetical protein